MVGMAMTTGRSSTGEDDGILKPQSLTACRRRASPKGLKVRSGKISLKFSGREKAAFFNALNG